MNTTTLRRGATPISVAALIALAGCGMLDRGDRAADAAAMEDRARAPISLVQALSEAAPADHAPDAFVGAVAELDGAALETRSVLYALHLASYRSDASAEAGWRIISTEAPNALDGLHPRVEQVDLGEERGLYLRLKAGPVDSLAEATARCAMLTQAGHYCRTDDYVGRDLAGG